jgi:hypothetical protein
MRAFFKALPVKVIKRLNNKINDLKYWLVDLYESDENHFSNEKDLQIL